MVFFTVWYEQGDLICKLELFHKFSLWVYAKSMHSKGRRRYFLFELVKIYIFPSPLGHKYSGGGGGDFPIPPFYILIPWKPFAGGCRWLKFVIISVVKWSSMRINASLIICWPLLAVNLCFRFICKTGSAFSESAFCFLENWLQFFKIWTIRI